MPLLDRTRYSCKYQDAIYCVHTDILCRALALSQGGYTILLVSALWRDNAFGEVHMLKNAGLHKTGRQATNVMMMLTMLHSLPTFNIWADKGRSRIQGTP